MIEVRKAKDRGFADHGWLQTKHTFSFGHYRDRNHMGFRSLRVMNEDRVAPGKGFGTHAHHNMEIVSYVLDGSLEHKDSMGNGEVLTTGQFQRITAGTGITHSEFNPSKDQPSHFYQIWLVPERDGLEPSYEQKTFAADERRNQLRLVASRDAADESLLIHQDAKIFLGSLEKKIAVKHALAPTRNAWLQVLRGTVSLNDQPLKAGDGAAIRKQPSLSIVAEENSEVLLFDLA